MKISINPRRVTQILLTVIVALTLLSVAGQYYKYFLGDNPSLLKIVAKLDLDGEANCLPTWFQICSLFLCSVVLAVITMAKRAARDIWARHWGFLAATFLYLSLDEAVSIHEQLSKLGQQVKANGLLHDFWVVPALFAVVVFGFSYLKFLWRLPFSLRWLMIIAGAIYVSGAVGMEIVSGLYLETHQAGLVNGENFTYKMLDTLEEFMEMLGVVLFFHANLSYLAQTADGRETSAAQSTFVFASEVSLRTPISAPNLIIK